MAHAPAAGVRAGRGLVIRRLAIAVTRRPARTLIAAGALFAAAVAFGAPVTGMLGTSDKDYQDPASQYERANAAITSASGQSPYYNVAVLIRSARTVDRPTLRRAGPRGPATRNGIDERAVQRVAGLLAVEHGFQRVLDYRETHAPALISRDGSETVVLAAFATDDEAGAAAEHVRAALAEPSAKAALDGASVRFGGVGLTSRELNERTTKDLTRAELLGLPFLLLLSFWFFRGLIAALLPVLVGGFAILLTFLALRVIDQVAPVSVFALNLVSGMGLGLGIDYSLFVVYRYREELASGCSANEAIERTLQTVGRTVLFSSVTVAAAMTSLLVFPMRFLYSMGIGGSVVALCDGAVALLVLPVVLLMLGGRINALSPRSLQRRAARSALATEAGGWWRLAHGVVRRPVPVAAASAAVLLVAAVPALRVTFTPPSANLLPASAESRQLESALAANFTANIGEATEIVLTGPSSSAQRLAAAASRAARGSARISAPTRLGRESWEIMLLPHGSPFAPAQQLLLSRLRALARPHHALVGGATAFFVDQRTAIASHIPLALLILVPLTAGFLFLMTGSLVVPIKALVMNALSVSVAVGLQVLIFQDGHLSGLLGFTPVGGLEESSLVLMLVLAFALATDYEVFVLARIKEAHDDGLANRTAVALGLERTGRVVTAAALLFCVAIGALTTSQLFYAKQMGLGAALAVAVDASIVRALLVPSLMALMGRWNWWAPPWLRRLHERIRLGETSPEMLAPELP